SADSEVAAEAAGSAAARIGGRAEADGAAAGRSGAAAEAAEAPAIAAAGERVIAEAAAARSGTTAAVLAAATVTCRFPAWRTALFPIQFAGSRSVIRVSRTLLPLDLLGVDTDSVLSGPHRTRLMTSNRRVNLDWSWLLLESVVG